jgi:hypothetical protein
MNKPAEDVKGKSWKIRREPLNPNFRVFGDGDLIATVYDEKYIRPIALALEMLEMLKKFRYLFIADSGKPRTNPILPSIDDKEKLIKLLAKIEGGE